VELSLLSAPELAAELGARIRRERLRQNLSQRTLAERAGVSRVTVTRMEATGAATLTNFLEVLAALRRTDDLDGILEPPAAQTIDEFVAGPETSRQRGRR
jgi:transcriptional regulator with XRE-family HTH domain